jgi:hypothetical protein
VKKIIVAAAAAALTLAACGSDQTQFDDAPVGVVDDQPQFVMTNLDGFPNIAFRCVGNHGFYTTTRAYGDAVNVIENDPNCENGEVKKWIADTFTGELQTETTEP